MLLRRVADGWVALVPGALLTTEVGRIGRADRDKPGLGQHLLGRDVLAGGGSPERAQPVPGRRQLAQFPHGRGRQAAAGDVLRDPVAEFRSAVPGEDQVEPAQDGAVLGDEHVVGTDADLLLSQQGAVLLGELVKELIAAVGAEGGEVGAVCQLEGQDRPGMAGTQPLQLWHSPSLLSWGAGDIWVSAGTAVSVTDRGDHVAACSPGWTAPARGGDLIPRTSPEPCTMPARRLSWPDRRIAPGAWPPVAVKTALPRHVPALPVPVPPAYAVEWWCPFLMPAAASPHDFWQDFLRADDPVLTAPSYQTGYPARLADGRHLLLPIRVLPGDGTRAVASLITNQASFRVLDAIADVLTAQVAQLGAEVVIGVPTLGLPLAEGVARRLGHPRMVALSTSR